MIDVQDLVKIYGTTRAVDGISFNVTNGDIVGFLGPNGAGKSTTMKMITCFIAPDGGVCRVAGDNVLENPLAVRKRIGYLPENTPLYEDLGVIEFLRFICSVRGIAPRDRKKRIAEVVDRCGLKAMVHKTIGQLSRGYRQRVGLAQALIHDPDILILDEPTSALDPTQIREIRELIKEIGKTKTILLSTHIMQEVTATCNRVIIISRGKIVAKGTPEELTGGTGATSDRIWRLAARANREQFAQGLQSLEGVKELATEVQGGDLGIVSARIVFDRKAGGEVGEKLFALAKDRGWILRELKEERLTLEEFFINVTTQG